MTLNELLNPWAALRRAKIEVDILRRELNLQAISYCKLYAELRKAQKNDQRGADGKFKKGEARDM